MQKKITLITCCLLLIISLGVVGCSSKSSSSSNDLVMFRGDPKHTGLLDTSGPTELHGVKWKFPTEGRIRSSPAFYNDAVYFGSEDQYFYAVNAETGTLNWKFATKGVIISSPAIMNGILYFLSGDGTFYALKAQSGELLWSFVTTGTNEARDPYDYWQSSPVVDQKIVYFGGGDGIFYALDAVKGDVKWKQNLHFQNAENFKDYPVTLHSSPVIDKGIVYIGLSGIIYEMQTEPGNVIALDALTGKQIWASNLMQAVDSSPTVDDQAIYFGMRNRAFQALDIKTGKPLWTNGSISYSLSSPAIHDGTIFSGSSDQHQLFALNASSGETKWSFPTSGAVHSSPVTDGTTVYCASGNSYADDRGFIYAIDAETGSEKWKLETGGNIFSSPTLHDGVLYVGNDDFNLYAIY
ncbi:outer membrane protein assembly factor BamB family protein [Paenibacillus segetis]|uniref:Pyrrolo-quinoline quinone repeat domain-containing protein n=1 Tax=Paenibacillus segetis TaxID=1325360 RepID=A0ABQ1YNL2_9BACL|nr:PQQ-binding-like beta-propeller repeat protein [Paenibacillus segetis]GGH31305.1 hypothetical protein GCM10008013_34940 [Paenibacillus segetis]